jgi:hypothetical protein
MIVFTDANVCTLLCHVFLKMYLERLGIAGLSCFFFLTISLDMYPVCHVYVV